MIQQVRTLFRYRLLIESLVSRELKARYRGSVLGFFWSFVNPLLMLLVYVMVFTVILPGRHLPAMEPYALFLFCGILPWSWLSASLLESSGVVIAGGNLIKKVLFPAEILPVVTVLTNLVQFLLGLPVLFGFLAAYGKLRPTALLLPLPILVQLVFTLDHAFVSEDAVHSLIAQGSLRVVNLPELPLVRPWHLVTRASPTPTALLFARHLLRAPGGHFRRP